MCASIQDYIERLAGLAELRFATVSETAESLGGSQGVVALQRVE